MKELAASVSAPLEALAQRKRVNMQFRDLGAQYRVLQSVIDQSILEAVRDGRYISGPQVQVLEEELAAYVGVSNCITCANGTDALQLALMAWGIGPGDAVFVPDFTFFSSGEVVAAVGATPVFVDVDGLTFNLDPQKLETAIQEIQNTTNLNLAAVVAVDLFGMPANYPAIRSICEKHAMRLLEDGAQGFGGAIGNRLVCSFGDISTTSFFPAKPLGCYGDGGAVFTDDDDLAALIRSFAVHGKGSFKYDNVRVGMNSRLDTLQAAVLLSKLDAFVNDEIKAVNEVAGWYDEALANCEIVLPVVPDGYRSSWAQYTIQLPRGADREAVQNALREKGIPTMVYYPKPMHEQEAFSGRCIASEGCPVTERLCSSVLSLPMGPYLAKDDVLSIAAALRSI